jgi:hypothetical protein
MNPKQIMAIAALTASIATSKNVAAQYETDVATIQIREKIMEAYRNNDFSKIELLKNQCGALNREVLNQDLKNFGVSNFSDSLIKQ